MQNRKIINNLLHTPSVGTSNIITNLIAARKFVDVVALEDVKSILMNQTPSYIYILILVRKAA